MSRKETTGEMSSADRRRLLRLGVGTTAVGGLAVAVARVLSPAGRADRGPVGAGSVVVKQAALPAPVPDIATVPTTVTAGGGSVVDRIGAAAVALTFDDGPDEQFTPRVLDFLADHHLHASFSLIGRQVERYPELARRVVAAGMTVCNHTWDHDEGLGDRSRADVEREVGRAQEVITACTRVAPGFFRAPGGSWSTTVLDVCGDAGLIPLGWDVDSQDWSRPGVAGIVANVTSEVRPGSVLLFHDGGGDREQTLAALPRVLRLLARRGYSITQILPGAPPLVSGGRPR